MAEKVASGAYRTVGEFVHDLRLVFLNCIDYWTPTVSFAIIARYLLNEVDLRVKELNFELATGTQVAHAAADAAGGSKAKGGKKTGKQPKHAAMTAAWTPAMQQAAAATAGNRDSATTPNTPTPSTPASPPLPLGSAAAAASLDFPAASASASASASSVLSASDHKKCSVIIHALQSEYGLFAKPANIPDYAELLSDYYVKVRHPNDLLTVSRRLFIHDYTSVDEFKADVSLIWDNALAYYSQPAIKDKLLDADDICALARRLKDDFNRRWESYERAHANKLVIKRDKSKVTAQPTEAATAQQQAAAAAAAVETAHSSPVKREDDTSSEAADSAARRLTAHDSHTLAIAATSTGNGTAATSAGPIHIKKESSLQQVRDVSLPLHTSVAASTATATTTALHTAASGSAGGALATLPSSSSSSSASHTLSSVDRKPMKKASGVLPVLSPAPPSNAAAVRPASPIPPHSPAALHRATAHTATHRPHAQTAASTNGTAVGGSTLIASVHRPPSANAAPSSSSSSSSRRSLDSAGAAVGSSPSQPLSTVSSSASLLSSVLSDVLPAPPKAKQRGGSVIKPLTAAQRRARVAEVSRKVQSTAARGRSFWQQHHQHQHQPHQQQQEATATGISTTQQHNKAASVPSSSSLLTGGRTSSLLKEASRPAVSLHSFHSLLPSTATGLLPPPPAPLLPTAPPASASSSSLPSPAGSHTRHCTLSVEAPTVSAADSGLLDAYQSAGFHSCYPPTAAADGCSSASAPPSSSSLLCRARHCLLPATARFPHPLDHFTVDLARVDSLLPAAAALSFSNASLQCAVSDRVGGSCVVMPSTARALDCSGAVALSRKRRRMDDEAAAATAGAASSQLLSAPPITAAVTGTAPAAASSVSSLTCRLLPPLTWSDREQLRLLPSALHQPSTDSQADDDVEGTTAAGMDAEVSDPLTALPDVDDDSDAVMSSVGDQAIALSLPARSNADAVYASLTQLSGRLDWHSAGFLLCGEQVMERQPSQTPLWPASSSSSSRSRRRYLSCCPAPSQQTTLPFSSRPPLQFARLSLFCFAGTTSLALLLLPGAATAFTNTNASTTDLLLPSPLHADGGTMLSQSVCRAWEQRVEAELRHMQQQMVEGTHAAEKEAEREWLLWKEEQQTLRDRLSMLVT